MTLLTNGFVDHFPEDGPRPKVNGRLCRKGKAHQAHKAPLPLPPDPAFLRQCAWEIGEARPADAYLPTHNHAGLAAVTPAQGFAHWRILPAWVEHTARHKGDAWHHCRLVLRLYDVSCIEFNGFNAHRFQDHDLPGLTGQFFFKLPRPGSWQLAEVGFLLRGGEFLPAARSQSVAFPRDGASAHGSQAALFVHPSGRVEELGNVWEQERILRERRQPRLKQPLRCASFALGALATGQHGWLPTFVSELAAGQAAHGHEAHVFVPASDALRSEQVIAGVHYHPLHFALDGAPLEQAQAFCRAAESRLSELPAFDVVHLHEWMTGIGGYETRQPVIRSLSSIEAVRRGNQPASDLSLEIERAERDAVRGAACVLTPGWLRAQAAAALDLEPARLHSFPMEGRLANEWEAPLDLGHVKMSIGLGPMDRMILFVGPLEHGAGVDVLLEALPTLLHRCGNLRLAYVGGGSMHGHLSHRAHQLGVAHAVRLLGHADGAHLTRLLRACEAVVLPSRYRVPQDDGVVDLARRAARPVVTTHAGPAHLVRHEDNGILTYDNPGSMVWAIDRILGDPVHADRMGQNGMRREESSLRWSDVARCYLELCAAQFPQLTYIRD